MCLSVRQFYVILYCKLCARISLSPPHTFANALTHSQALFQNPLYWKRKHNHSNTHHLKYLQIWEKHSNKYSLECPTTQWRCKYQKQCTELTLLSRWRNGATPSRDHKISCQATSGAVFSMNSDKLWHHLATPCGGQKVTCKPVKLF